MSQERPEGGLHIDSDWKEEAAREKEQLAQQEAKEQQAKGAPGAEQPGNFIELVNLLAMQAVIGLGGYQGPGGERIPPNPAAAKHNIDLLEVLKAKTSGNLSEDETKVLDGVLHELRMQFVHAASAPPPPPAAGESQ